MRIVIWIIGGNSVGKTTQARLFHDYFSELAGEQTKPELVKWTEQGVELKFTLFNSFSANLGDLTTNQCGGTDTLNTKHQIVESFNEALKQRPVVIVEGIMATGQWIHFLKTKETRVFLFYLSMTDKQNFNRLRKRRAEKQGVEWTTIELKEKTMDNLSGKLRGFESLYNRMKDLVDESYKINVDGKLPFDVFDKVLIRFEKFVNNI